MKRGRLLLLTIFIFSLVLTLSGCSNTSTNRSPIADYTADPKSGKAPLEVTFNASVSVDPDGNIINYEWSFGDSSTGSGATVTNTYKSAGDYTVTLTVTDNDGVTDSVSGTINVKRASQKELEIIESSFYERDFLGYAKIEGQAKNTSGHVWDYAELYIKLYNEKDSLLNSLMTNITNLAPGEIWKFEISSFTKYKKIDHIKIKIGDCYQY